MVRWIFLELPELVPWRTKCKNEYNDDVVLDGYVEVHDDVRVNNDVEDSEKVIDSVRLNLQAR